VSEDCHDSNNWDIEPSSEPSEYRCFFPYGSLNNSLLSSAGWDVAAVVRHLVNLGVLVPREIDRTIDELCEDVQVRDNFLLHEMGIASIELDAKGKIVV
jgi:hypothetical protein